MRFTSCILLLQALLLANTAQAQSNNSTNNGTNALTQCQQSIVQQLTNIFENSVKYFPWDYCENIGDGRGYTCGIVGFTTGTHDALQVISAYAAQLNSSTPNPFGPYMSRLIQLNQSTIDGSTSGLDGFCNVWSTTARSDQLFRTVQVDMVNQLYYNPAMAYAARNGLQFELSKGQMYDAAIQHGTALSEADSLPSMIDRTTASFKSGPNSVPGGLSEVDWLTAFMNVRIETLQNPAYKPSQAGWSQSIYRVKSYQYALSQGSVHFNDSLTALDNDGNTVSIGCDLTLWNYVGPPLPIQTPKKGILIGVLIGVGVLVLLIVTFCIIKRRLVAEWVSELSYRSKRAISRMSR
ncbi:lysozyme-like domain-containing protein [Polychytrium aggregatum]|uniref:lysozyme-like domain-containing protein n=1 Tax=Polychytrium aggregatum TaxID=110093 RepID=UPI0022FF1B7C|nr:lysozyme-like domain-containing protein [Polychytrium aggregatum]KAI9202889.1 lysozyme-like domain-containing protein [Polychytrium aggregatum]